MKLELLKKEKVDKAMEIIESARAHLKAQGIDQWQQGYPDLPRIQKDAEDEIGYFVVDNEEILGYLCIDYRGEPAYNDLKGKWNSDEKFVVVHRMAMGENARGKKLTNKVFKLVEDMSKEKGVSYFRIDTDEENNKMKHVLTKNGFKHCGTVCFDNSEKVAFDKLF